MFVPSEAVGVRLFASGEGDALSISPLSLVVTMAGARDSEFVTEDVVVRFADGTERVVEEAATGTINSHTQTLREDESSSDTLVGLVDVDAVESVIVTGHWPGRKGEDARVTRTFTPVS